MRTTIDITDEQRSKLLEIAGKRGEKDLSPLVQEAVDLYLRRFSSGDEAVDEALQAIGSLSRASADRLEESVHDVRRRWR